MGKNIIEREIIFKLVFSLNNYLLFDILSTQLRKGIPNY